MSSIVLRNHVYNRLSGASVLNALGLTTENLYPNFSPDSPKERRFAIIRWGQPTPALGRANYAAMTLWAYDRDPDYSWIAEVLSAARGVLVADPVRLSDVDWTMDTTWQGGSDDLYDDGYVAYTKNDSYRIVATGI